jgi:hypothetical protein
MFPLLGASLQPGLFQSGLETSPNRNGQGFSQNTGGEIVTKVIAWLSVLILLALLVSPALASDAAWAGAWGWAGGWIWAGAWGWAG